MSRVEGFDYKKAEADLWNAGCHYPEEIWSMREEKSIRNMMHEYGLNEQKYYKKEPAANNSPSASSDGCYVATCVYGSYDCPEVWTLRRFRDNTLGKTWYGRSFIRAYYACSPTIVKWFGDTTWFKKLWRGKLDRLVAALREQGVENTPYEDRDWR